MHLTACLVCEMIAGHDCSVLNSCIHGWTRNIAACRVGAILLLLCRQLVPATVTHVAGLRIP
jgi:hypothetical protein